jgi:hypothetical protein
VYEKAEEKRQRGVLDKEDDFIMRPFSTTALSRKMREILEGEKESNGKR